MLFASTILITVGTGSSAIITRDGREQFQPFMNPHGPARTSDRVAAGGPDLDQGAMQEMAKKKKKTKKKKKATSHAS